MLFLRSLQVCCPMTLFVLAVSVGSHAATPDRDGAPPLVDGERITGRDTPDAAATDMFRAIATQDHNLFIQTRLLGVCEGQNDWPSRYAECLHMTKLTSGDDRLTVYDMTRRLLPDTIRVVSTKEFDVPHGLLVSSFYGEQFVNVELVIANYDGVEYRTRIVVAKNSDRWYAIPRRGRCGFYSIADAIPSAGSKPKSE